MSDDVKIPGGRLGRFRRMATVGLRSGAGMLLNRDGKASAQYAAEVLGQLRGLAAKVGQMAGYVDGVIPSEHRGAYEAALSVLQAAAPRSSAAQIRLVVENELGAPIDRLFTTWDDTPIASASIGQVHRALLTEEQGGFEVAVKVQHPGIEAAFASDLANAGMLESSLSFLGGRRVNSAEVLEAVRTRFGEELDYSLEARHMDFFRQLSAGDSRCSIPDVIAARSSRRVLTTRFIRGKSFVEACAATEKERGEWARTLWRFVFRGNLVGARFNADPHPGNYFFHDDGAVTFIDFGCVNPIGGPQHLLARAIHQCAILGDERGFRAATRRLFPTRPGRLEAPSIEYMRRAFEPLFGSPFRITRDYAASLVDGMGDLAKLALKTPSGELFQMPPDMVFMNRLQFGFYSVLARLDVEQDYAAVERGLWPEVEQAWGSVQPEYLA